jgi:hypothetical protein
MYVLLKETKEKEQKGEKKLAWRERSQMSWKW